MRRQLATFLFVAILLVGFWQFDNVSDWWFLRNYQPSAEISALADRASLSDAGRREFYLANPTLNDKQTFSSNCPVGEVTLVLGCYSGGKIYVLEVDRSELAGVMEVTAAHEMLHAAYLELSTSERHRINQQIEDFYASYGDADLKDLVAEYEKAEPGQRLNELHSLLGTQVATLSPQLEEYYSQYFTERNQVVTAYSKYEAVFSNIETQINALSSELDNLKQQVINLEQQLDSQRAELETTNERMNNFLTQGIISQYNSLVPVQNSQVQRYNLLIKQYQGLISAHNQKADQLNSLALEQRQLRDALDSSKQPIDN